VKYAHLVWAALRRKPTRTILTALSIITAFFLFGILQGVNVGITKLVMGARETHLLVLSRMGMATPLPVAHAARIEKVPGVAAAAPTVMMFGTYQGPRNSVLVAGTDVLPFFRVNAGLMSATPEDIAKVVRTRTGALVGKSLAKTRGWKVGDRIPIHALNMRKADGSGDWVFDIVGYYDNVQPDTSMWLVANYDYLNEPRGDGRNTVFDIAVAVTDPAQIGTVAQAIDDLFANSSNQTLTRSERDFLETTLNQVGDINFIVTGILAAVMFTLLFLTANTMAQSVRERIPEMAVLKTIGFTDASVQWLVLAEALVLCVITALIGLALAAAVLPLVSNSPGLGIAAMHIPSPVFGAGTAAAVVVALISGLPLALKARRLEIAAALAGR
jgi:putative ABC transport system permease protein